MSDFQNIDNSVVSYMLCYQGSIQNGMVNDPFTQYRSYTSNLMTSSPIQNANSQMYNMHEIDFDVANVMNDNEQFSSQVKNLNSSNDVDNLVATCSAQYERLIQNGMVNDPVTKYLFDTSSSVSLLPIKNSNSQPFQPILHDTHAMEFIYDSQQISPQIENWDDLDKWIDRQCADEQSMHLQTFESPETTFNSGMINKIPPSHSCQQYQFKNSNQNNMIGVSSPTNYGIQQSSSYGCCGLQYKKVPSPQPIPSPICHFGTTEVTSYIPVVPVQPTTHSESLSMKKSKKKMSKNTSSTPPSNLPPFNMDEWWVYENGKRRRPLLYEFLRKLLDNRNYSHIAQYVKKEMGIFKIDKREEAAELWQFVKGRNSDNTMTYDKLARGIRFYYKDEIIQRSRGRFTFRFGWKSGFGTNWTPV